MGQIKFIIFQFIMIELESCIRGFHVYYVSWTPHEGEVLHCSCEIANREDSYAVAVHLIEIQDENTRILGNTLFKLTQNLLSSVLLWSCFVTCTVRRK